MFNKKILNYLGALSVISLPLISASCNIRESQNYRVYSKFSNEEKTTREYLITNEVKRISNDYESLLNAPLIRYTFNNKARLDNINKKYFEVTTKHLEFELAKEIILTLNTGEKIAYNQDNVINEIINPDSFDGIVQIYNDEKGNINNHQFEKDLKNSTQVEFVLKDDLYYSDYQGNKTNIKITANDFWNSFNFNNNRKNLDQLFNNYNLSELNQIDFQNNSLIFKNASEEKNFLALFVLKEITNNSIFSPLWSTNKEDNTDLTKIKFASSYILNKNVLNQQVFIKNNNYAKKSFVENSKNLQQITLNYNPLPINDETFRLQMFNSFKQNLVSEVDYNIFNTKQKQEIDNNQKIFGLTFKINQPSDQNVIKYFPNLLINETSKYNNHFASLYFGVRKNNASEIFKYYNNANQIAFRQILNNVFNQYTATVLNNHSQYWNSFASQSMYLDAKDSNEVNQKNLYQLKDYINTIDYYEYKDDDFKKNVLTFDLDSNLVMHYYDKNNISKINNQLKSPLFNQMQNTIKSIIDEYYLNNNINGEEKIQWVIPVFKNKSDYLDNFYSYQIAILKELDSRLEPSFEYVLQNNSSYFNNYYGFYNVDNSFSNYVIELLKNSKSSLLYNLASYRQKDDFQAVPWNDELIYFTDNLENILGIQLKDVNQELLVNSDDLFIILFKDKETYNNKINGLKNWIQSLNTTNQLALLKFIDNMIGVRATEDNYLFTNNFDKSIVQYYFKKPLNDLGITYFQDIEVLI